MQVHTHIDSIQAIQNPILTIGTFDGVHLGHRAIIARLNEIAQEENGQSVLLTFHPHPRTIVNEAGTIELLTTLEERLELLREAGLRHVIVHPFTQEFSRISALEYVRDLLVNKIGIHFAVVGYDHHFGRNREGDIHLFKELADLYSFKVEEISAQEIKEVKVSSTKVRKALKEGKVQDVKSYLGYNYFLEGTVVSGEGRGKELGFPTANILPNDVNKLVPGNGVYAVKVVLEERPYFGMLNIGTRPTFTSGADVQRSLEVNIFNFNQDLYGKELKIEFKYHIRSEKRFDSADELKIQLNRDKETSLSLLDG